MGILKCFTVFIYLAWAIVAVLALINPTIKSLVPLIVCSTSLICFMVTIKDD